MEQDVPTFAVDGVTYPFAQDLTLDEARDLKHIYGVKLGELEALMTEGDPDALCGFVFLSMRRVDSSVTPAQAGRVSLTELGNTLRGVTADTPAEAVEGEPHPLASSPAE